MPSLKPMLKFSPNALIALPSLSDFVPLDLWERGSSCRSPNPIIANRHCWLGAPFCQFVRGALFRFLIPALALSAHHFSLRRPQRQPMSFMYPSSYPKVRQEGFHLPSQHQGQSPSGGQPLTHHPPHPTPNAFDPNSIYTTGALFADAFRTPNQDGFRRFEPQQPQQPASLDIHEELSYMHPNNQQSNSNQQRQQSQSTAEQSQSYASPSDNFPRPHDIFGVNQPHLSSFSVPHNRPLFPREDFSTTTPASVHNSYGRSDFFGAPSNADSQRQHPEQLTLSQQQQQQQFGLLSTATRPLSSSGDPTGLHSPLVDHFKPGGPQSPAGGPTRSRSRSRSKVSTSRARVSKRPSLPPPDEPSGSSRGTSTSRPPPVVIPGQGQHSYSNFGGQPNSATWFDQYSTPQNGESVQSASVYGHSFGPGSLPVGNSPSGQNGSPPTANISEAAAKLALANEKRRKRRESHNAVERRRRDNINEKIQELAMLLPDEWLEGNVKPGTMAGLLSGTVSGSIGGDEDTKEVKANKGVILKNSVEYIKNLVQLVQAQRARNQQLESELAEYRNRFGPAMENGSHPNGHNMSGVDHLGHINMHSAQPGAGANQEAQRQNGQASEDENKMGDLIMNQMGSPGVDLDFNFNMFGMNMVGGVGDAGSMGLLNGSDHQHMQNSVPMNMLVDTQSPSTGSGEGDMDDDEVPRGRGRDRGSRFPSGAKREEVVINL